MRGSANTVRCAKERIFLLFFAQRAHSTFVVITGMCFAISIKRVRKLVMQVQISFSVQIFMREQYARKRGWQDAGFVICSIAWLTDLRINMSV